jgi:GMP synthase-like glutamine amidotransferase
MRIHCLIHMPFEELGSIEPALRAAGHVLSYSRLYASPELPPPDAFDGLVAMGGPMSVNDEGQFPWLVAEKRLIGDATRAGKSVLGICLGAQLIASSLGARVYPNDEREIGWFPVEGIAADGGAPYRFPASLLAFHWHGETFDLPLGAVRLARSEACENQAFLAGERILALQFHLETTPASARALVDNCRDELTSGRYVQREDAILAPVPGAFASIERETGRILDFLFGA